MRVRRVSIVLAAARKTAKNGVSGGLQRGRLARWRSSRAP